jgi:P27 family predicted phage terminase small subunit
VLIGRVGGLSPTAKGERPMPGPTPKPPSRRIRTTTKAVGVIRAAGTAPRMPAGLCSAAQNAWRDYFADTVSGVIRPADASLVLRWVRNLDRYHRLVSEADREPVVIGSQLQPRPNPLYDMVFKIEASLRADEAQLGIGPLSRLRLGAQLSENARTLAEMNAEVTSAADPRATLAIVANNNP